MPSPETTSEQSPDEARSQQRVREIVDQHTPRVMDQSGDKVESSESKLLLLQEKVLHSSESGLAERVMALKGIKELIKNDESLTDRLVLDESGSTPETLRQERKNNLEALLTDLHRRRAVLRQEAVKLRTQSSSFSSKYLSRFFHRSVSSQTLLEQAENKDRSAADIDGQVLEESERWVRNEMWTEKRVVNNYFYNEASPLLGKFLAPYSSEDGQQNALVSLGEKNLLLLMFSDKDLGDPLGEQNTHRVGDKVFQRLQLVNTAESDLLMPAREFLKGTILADFVAGTNLFKNRKDFVVQSLPWMLMSVSEDEKNLIISSLDQSIDKEVISTWLNNPERRRVMAPGLNLLLRYGAENTRSSLDLYIEELFVKREMYEDDLSGNEARSALADFSQWTWDWDDRKFDFRNKDLGNAFVGVLGRYLNKKYSVTEDVAKSWVSEKSYGFRLESNLFAMDRLEADRIGSTKLLCEKYGIREFARYPYELLKRQVEIDAEDVPYGLVVYPRADHSDSYDEDIDLFRQFMDELQGKHDIRVVEAASGTDLYRKLITLRKNYDEKIAFLVLAGHGEKNAMDFGGLLNNSEHTSLHTHDVESSGAMDQIRDMLVPDPSVVLFSCSTGTEGGIAQELSKQLRAHVEAPREPAHPMKIFVNYDGNEKPRLDVEYDIPKSQTAYYVNGETVSE